ncbi:MAG: amidohydrolase family protein [Candidatus Dormiibacterota bacterium]
MSEGTGAVRLVDAHHHLWDLDRNRYPWLNGPDAEPGAPSYRVEDYLADLGDAPVLRSVHVEAAFEPADPVGETRWLQEVAERHGFPHAIVAHAALERPDAGEVLAEHVRSPNVRGIREMLDRDLATQVSRRTKLLQDPRWLAGLRRLPPLGLSFDLQVLPSQLEEAAAVARAVPDLLFLLNHGGYHVRASPEEEAQWRRGIRALAAQDNVVVKASGYDAVDPTWPPDGFDSYVYELLEVFGVERALFGTNFPVEKRSTTFPALLAAYKRATAGLSPSERDAFYYGNAMRCYRLEG